MSERFNWQKQNVREKPGDGIGPGQYAIPSAFKEEIRPVYAPFCSTNGLEESPDWMRRKVPDISPDPGTYDPKPPRAYDSGLPKKHVPFTSSASRLEVVNAKGLAPGPGEYNSSSWKPAPVCNSRTMGVPQAASKVLFKSTSAPSIPRDHQCFGYEEAGGGRLVRQGRKDSSSWTSGRPGESVGPGQYDLSAVIVGKNGKINPGPSQKGYPGAEKIETPGPGHYVVQVDRGEKPYYSAFASQSERGSKKAADTPGPGQYYGPRPARPSLREEHAELQYFGSTTERFLEGRGSRSVQPGPGAYGDGSLNSKQKGGGRWSTSGRWQDGGATVHADPGPGTYDPAGTDGKTTGPTGTVSILGSTGSLAFGSMESRSRGGGMDRKEGPGPGAYYSYGGDEAALEINNSTSSRRPAQKRRLPGPSMSMFQSLTPKDVMMKQYEKEGQFGPPPGAYSPGHVHDVGAVLRIPPKNEGFGSGANRSGEDVKSFTAPGPGWYNPADVTGGKVSGTFNRSSVEGGPAFGRPKGLGFESQTKRFASASKVVEMPGPATYKTDPSWIQTTHNVHFGNFG
ncbi:unnamed protein product [Polarella glacialis]|uniref:Sperm-tail PG-rich repeat-containing protein 2 n=1 Tax=Polarella glacialis TaxID=89957 RepID=A0A813G164_POLGL|nr:unnamed protein product [Polarella glacialis]